VNWLDYILIAVLAISTVLGFAKGLTRMVVGLAAAVLAILLAFRFYHGAALLFCGWWDLTLRNAKLAAFFAIFAGVLVLGGVLAAVVGKTVHAVGLKSLDRLAGAFVGFVRGVVVIAVIVAVIMAANAKTVPECVRDSRLAPQTLRAANLLVKLAPPELRDAYEISKSKLLEIWDELKGAARPGPVDKL
jgi:membrane protein required for colicin V production